MVELFFSSNFFFEKSIFANRLKRVLPKFRADPSFVREVNGRSKFRKKCQHPERPDDEPAVCLNIRSLKNSLWRVSK